VKRRGGVGKGREGGEGLERKRDIGEWRGGEGRGGKGGTGVSGSGGGGYI